MTHKIPSPHKADHLEPLLASTPARLGVWRAGTRPLSDSWLKFRLDHAIARDAIASQLSDSFLSWAQEQGFPVIQSLSTDRSKFVLCPPSGKRAAPETIKTLKTLCRPNPDVQIVISDGLSARAVEANIPDLLPMIEHGLKQESISLGVPVVVKFGRVAIADQIGFALGCRLVINLIGERPGLSSSSGLSAYITYQPGPGTISSDRTVVSNIHLQGTPPSEAGAYIVSLVKEILQLKVSGVALQRLR